MVNGMGVNARNKTRTVDTLSSLSFPPVFHMEGLAVAVLLLICSCAYMKRVPRLRELLLSEKRGVFGALYKGVYPLH